MSDWFVINKIKVHRCPNIINGIECNAITRYYKGYINYCETCTRIMKKNKKGVKIK